MTTDKLSSRKHTPPKWTRASQAAMLNAIAAAPDVEALEHAIQTPGHPWDGARGVALRAARVRRGEELCDTHPHGRLVPRVGPRRLLTVCGENYRVGYGGNSAGERCAWHGARKWAVSVLTRNGLGVRASHRVWGWAGDYPHRALPIVEAALRGELPDPEVDVLQVPPYRCTTGRGVRCTLESAATGHDRRASRMCECGGVLFDWGWSPGEGFQSISWACNACDRRYTEYVSEERLGEIRRRPSHDALPFHRGRPSACVEVAA